MCEDLATPSYYQLSRIRIINMMVALSIIKSKIFVCRCFLSVSLLKQSLIATCAAWFHHKKGVSICNYIYGNSKFFCKICAAIAQLDRIMDPYILLLDFFCQLNPQESYVADGGSRAVEAKHKVILGSLNNFTFLNPL